MSKIRWSLVLGLSAAFLALAVFLYRQGLEHADKWASVLALFAALTTLTTGLLSKRRERNTEPTNPASPITNNGVVGQIITGRRARVRQKNKFYYK